MQVSPTTIAPALKALLNGFIDYAGIFPPAGLPLEQAVANFIAYRKGQYSWMLHNFVVNSGDLASVPQALDGALAVLGNVDEKRAATLETKHIVNAERPVYCEVAPGNWQALDAIKQSGCFAKLRTGGITPEAVPACADVAAFIEECAVRQLAFKATAGLHHAVRSLQPLTCDTGAVKGTMHGFLNVLMAAAFAWHGERQLEPILAETDVEAFSFGQRACWRDKSLDAAAIEEARLKFIHSIGSCSFAEPVADLRNLGLL